MSGVIDLRSDTVTQPTEEMRRAMATALVGDDVYGEDPTVAALEEECAALLGHAAALFVPTGTMANQIAIHLSTRPGDEVLIEGSGHSYDWELSGMAVISSVQPRVLTGDRGVFDAAAVAEAVAERPSMRSRVALAGCGPSRPPLRSSAFVATAASPCTSMARACSTLPWRAACRRRNLLPASTP